MSSQEQIILDAAKKLIDTAVDHQFTMDQLVAETNLSRATIYRRFGSKNGLLKRLAETGDVPTATLENADTRSRILKAAGVIFGQYGILNATMEQVAKEANVGIATVYRQFGDKETLIRTYFEEESPHRLIREMNIEHSADIEANLIQIVKETLTFLQQNRSFLGMTFASSVEANDYLAQIRETPTRTLHRLAAFFETEIDAGRLKAQDPQNMAAALLGMTLSFGVIVPFYYEDVPQQSLSEKAQFIVDLFLDGVRGDDKK